MGSLLIPVGLVEYLQGGGVNRASREMTGLEVSKLIKRQFHVFDSYDLPLFFLGVEGPWIKMSILTSVFVDFL